MKMTSDEIEASTLLAESCNNNMDIASREKDHHHQAYNMEQASSYLTTSFSRKEDHNNSPTTTEAVGYTDIPHTDGDFPTCPLITNPSELSTPHADKIKTVPCRQIPGSPDMSPVMKRRRTALAKKAMELQRDGKITRIRVVGAASVILEFCDAKEYTSDCDDMSCTTTGTCRTAAAAASDEWQRYKSPSMTRRQIHTNTRDESL